MKCKVYQCKNHIALKIAMKFCVWKHGIIMIIHRNLKIRKNTFVTSRSSALFVITKEKI